MAVQLISACEHMLQKGVVHYDLKPDNILIKDDAPLLADFGGVQYSHGGPLNLDSLSYAYTPEYCAPEFLRCYYSEFVDLSVDGGKCVSWSVGCTLAEMVTGERLVKNRDVVKKGEGEGEGEGEGWAVDECLEPDSERYQTIIEDYFSRNKRKIKEPMLSVLRKLLVADPAERASLEAFDVSALERYIARAE